MVVVICINKKLRFKSISIVRLESSCAPRLDLDGVNVFDEMELADGSSNMQ